MHKFKAAWIAKFENKTILYWKFPENSHFKLMESLVKEKGEPLAVCPIEVTGGRIKIDLENDQKEPWMEDYIEENRKKILDIEVRSLEWMKTHELKILDIRHTQGFVIPRGSRVEKIFADGAKGLVFDGPVVSDYLDLESTENVVIPNGSRVKEIYAYGSKGLVFEGPVVASYLNIGNTENVVIPRGSRVEKIFASSAKNLVIEDDCEIKHQ